MHDFMTAQLESIIQSTLGIGDVDTAAPPPAAQNNGKYISPTAGSSTSKSSIEAPSRVNVDIVDRPDACRVQKTSSRHNISGGKNREYEK